MGILAIVQTVLEILKEFLTWQVGLTKLKTEKLAYDIDQQEKAKGRDLIKQIDAARNAGDLNATSLYLDDQADSALFTARIRSSVSDLSGPDLGVSGGIPAPAAPDGGTHDSTKPAPSAEPDPTVTHAPSVPVHTIPKVPFAVTGGATWWGINPDGSDDKGDVDQHGKALLGAFGDDNHNEQIIGASIPIKLFHQTVGGSGSEVYKSVHERKYTLDVLSHVTGRHLTGVWLTDLGPAARLHRPLDLTYAANKMLGHTNGENICTWWLTGPKGIMEIKGWDFAEGKVIGS